MFSTKGFKTREEKEKEKNTIHIPAQQHFEKFNAFAGGYGAHDKSKKAKHKADRKANKKLCREPY